MSWTLIEHQALSSSAASVTLGSGGTIPQTYKTLKLVVSGRCDGAFIQGAITPNFNGSTANFTARFIDGTGSSAASYTLVWFGTTAGSQATASTFASMEVTIPNYSGSTNKPFSTDTVVENNATPGYQDLIAGLWSNTAAITSIVLAGSGGSNWVSGSTFTLYGLA